MKSFELKKTKKLSTTLVVLSVIVLLALNVVLAVCMSVITSRGMNKKQNAFLEQTLSNGQHQIDDYIKQYAMVAQTVANNTMVKELVAYGEQGKALSMSPDFQETISIMNNMVEFYPEIIGMGIGSVSENALYHLSGKKVRDDLKAAPFYPAVTENRIYVTPPYMDAVLNELCVSIGIPITDKNTVTGLLCVDLDLSQLSEFLEKLAFGESGRMILLSDDNTIIGCANQALVGTDFKTTNVSESLLKDLENPSATLVDYKLAGVSQKGMAVSISDFGWKLIVGMTTKEYRSQTNATISLLIVMLLLSTTITAAILYMIVVKKLHPITTLKRNLKEMSEGNLQLTIIKESDDEIGEMAESLQNCVTSLSSYVHEINTVMAKLSNGDLTAKPEIEFKGDFIPIQSAVSEFIDKLTHLISNISTASEQVTAGSEQVSVGAQALAQGATHQASSVQELATTIAGISETVKSNSDMARMASDNAVLINNEIIESSQMMNQSLELMEEIRSTAGKAVMIVKTIEDIAFQTSVLALNAAVEAARAGQAGKGFAVVADEVRNLAAKSAEASRGTTELIDQMSAAIEKGSISLNKTKLAVDGVVKEAAEITGIFQKISEASAYQATSISQVTQGTDQISSVVQTNSATAQESAAASEELSSQANLLKNLISKFKIERHS